MDNKEMFTAITACCLCTCMSCTDCTSFLDVKDCPKDNVRCEDVARYMQDLYEKVIKDPGVNWAELTQDDIYHILTGDKV